MTTVERRRAASKANGGRVKNNKRTGVRVLNKVRSLVSNDIAIPSLFDPVCHAVQLWRAFVPLWYDTGNDLIDSQHGWRI